MKGFTRLAIATLMSIWINFGALAATNHFACGNSGLSAYVINGENNPDLTLVRGFTYTFQLNAAGHPFYIKIVKSTGTLNAYSSGVTGNGTSVGTVTFAVPSDAPDLLYYNCQFHALMTGELHIVDAPDVSITEFFVGTTDALFASTGTDALNVNVLVNTNLTTNVWAHANILSNNYSNGTNSTQVALPEGDTAVFQVQQGFF